MNIPQLQEDRTYSRSVGAFLGYNVNPEIGNGENHDEYNLTADEYPLLANRKPRHSQAVVENDSAVHNAVYGMIIKNDDTYIIRYNNASRSEDQGYTLHKNGSQVTGSPKFNAEQKIVSMGAKLIFYPAFVSYNTVSGAWENGELTIAARSSTTQFRSLTIQPCNSEGAGYTGSWTFGDKSQRPSDPSPGEYFADTDFNVAYEWDADNSAWIQLTDVHTRINFASTDPDDPITPFADVSDHDSLSLSFPSGATPSASIAWLEGNQSVIAKVDDNSIVLDAFPKGIYSTYTDDTLIISRRLPNVTFDHIIEHNNRLFACRYGNVQNVGFINEIYASALGEPWNWYCFQGISTDSYTVSLGSDGPFTGAIVYNGYPTFFKENYIHRIFGQYPENFQLDTAQIPGVQSGCGNSLVIMDGVLYYKSASGFMAYTSGLPQSISAALGDTIYKDVKSAYGNHKIYYSCLDSSSNTVTLVYDTVTRTWHKELMPRFSYGGSRANKAVYQWAYESEEEVEIEAQEESEEESETGTTVTIYHIAITSVDTQEGTGWGAGSTMESVKDIPWMFESALFGLYIHSTNYRSESLDTNHEYINRLLVKTQLDPDSEMAISISYDGGEYEQIYHIFGHSLRSFDIPIKPRRCEHFRLKFEGKGYVRIYSIVQQIREGSQKK